MSVSRRAVQYVLALLVVSCSLSTLAAQTPGPRIRERISDNARLPLHGSRSPLADAGKDLGPVSPEKTLSGIALVFKRSGAQQTDLEALLAAQQDQASPRYHRWLTATAFAARFGVADADLAATQAWLKAHGFAVDAVPPSRDRILFTGSVSQIKAAFGAELHSYDLNGDRHFGPATDLSLPAALAPVTAAVLHLSDLRPKPNSRPLPALTDAATGTHFLTPGDLGVIYDLNPAGATSLTGAGQSIAIVADSYVDLNLFGLNTFQTALGYAIGASIVLVPDSGVEAVIPGAQAEAELDLEYAAATAPLANFYLVFVGDNPNTNVFDALTYSIQQNIAPIISISFATCEALLSPGEADSTTALFQQAAAQGQTIVSASGDSGSTGCSRFVSSSLTDAERASLTVEFPGSSPLVTAVGGTQMAPGTFAAGTNPYWSAVSSSNKISVLSYVPEVTWNEGSSADGISASGGGASAIFGRPAWQNAFPSMPAGSTRLVPDIALQSSIQAPGYLLCTDDIEYVGPDRGDSCFNHDPKATGQYIVAGGTSFAAPVFAASVALLNQYEQEQGQGYLNSTLYQLASNPATYAAAFHDITSGSNACVSGASGCTPAGQAGYSAGPGFDEATGLGSVDFSQLRAAWPSNPGRNAALQALNGSCGLAIDQGSVHFDPGTPVQISCKIVPNTVNDTPGTGSVSVFLDQAPLGDGSPIPLGSGLGASFTVSFTAPATTGSHLLKVSYPGDTTHLPLTIVYPFMVGPIQASGSFTLSASGTALGSNASTAVPITITPDSAQGYHGVLYWKLSATQTSGTSNPTLCYSISPVRVSGTTTATLQLGTGAACNSPLPSASSATRFLPGRQSADSQPTSSRPGVTACAMLFGVGLLGRGLRRRRPGRTGLACLILLSAVPLLGGCAGGKSPATTGGSGSTGSSGNTGSSGSSGTTTPATQPAVLTLTLRGTDSVNTSVAANIDLTVTLR